MLGTASLVEILTVTFRSPSLPAGSRKMSQPVITIDAALSALASANTPDELITLANQAAALQVYARRAKLGMVAQNRCAEIRLRAERKLGELLTMTPRLHGRPKSVPGENTLPSLSRESGPTDGARSTALPMLRSCYCRSARTYPLAR